MVPGEPFFLMREGDGEPNSETLIEVLERRDHLWRYALTPITGRKHQLRLHMATLGAGICNDPSTRSCYRRERDQTITAARSSSPRVACASAIR